MMLVCNRPHPGSDLCHSLLSPSVVVSTAHKAGTTGVHKVSSSALPLAVPGDQRYCGLVYMLLVLDSTLQVPEISELNNVSPKRVTVMCPGGE